MKDNIEMDKKIISYIKVLGLDMISKAGSGHPGIVLGAAPIIYTLYSKHLNVSVADSNWINRDRFVLSAGHGSALLYATLHLAGFDISTDDLKNFRRVGYKTPGHPENFITPGVDMTTGPLGQGIASAVGMALASKINKSKYKTKNGALIDYNVYVLCGDGDLMEGVSYEALSLAGSLGLDNLIVLYDSNQVSLDGKIDKTFNEDIKKRFEAMNFDTYCVNKGNDLRELNHAIISAKKSSKPSIIEVKTIIGEGSLLEGTHEVHGKVLSSDDLKQLKSKLGISEEAFDIPDYIKSNFKSQITNRVITSYSKWNEIYKEILANKYDNNIESYKKDIYGLYKYDVINMEWSIDNTKKEATRDSNGHIMTALVKKIPNLIGGSADLSSSTKTYLYYQNDISRDNFDGKNIWYGVREHAMGAITNGLALSGFHPFCSTFLTFADYLKPSIRLAAIMKIPSIFIFSHDSVNIGQDGPTHQPIEQLAMLRSIPNLRVYRPADAKEIVGCWDEIINNNEPSCLILSRQETDMLESTDSKQVKKGAYIVKKEFEKLDAIIIATGSEVATAINIAIQLYEERGLDIRVVSMPEMKTFLNETKEYQESILPIGYKKFVIEAGSSFGWHQFVYNEKYLMTIDHFGISGTKDEVLKYCQFDFKTIKDKISKLI